MVQSPNIPTPATVADRYRVLLDIGHALAELPSAEAIHGAIHRQTLRVLEADGFYIFLWDEETDRARVVYWADGTRAERSGTTFYGTDSQVIREGRAVRVDDNLSTRSLAVLGGRQGELTRSAAAAPLRTADGIMGGISVQSYRAHAYGDAEMELLQGIADVASVALRHAQQVHEVEARRREAERVLDIVRALTSTLDDGDIMDQIVLAGAELLGADNAQVWVLEEAGIRLGASTGEGVEGTPQVFSLEGRLAQLLLEDREAVIFQDLKGSSLVPPELRSWLSCSSALVVPLVAGDRTVGALTVGSQGVRPFSPGEARLLNRLATHAALALENARLHARLRALSLTDPLTGLPNRRHLEIHLTQEFAAAHRGRELSIVLFDLDDFKQYNDALGHLAGDDALRAVAEIMDSETRAMNLVARYGGDEFVAVLSDTDLEGARRHARRVARRLARHPLLGPLALRASYGVAQFDPSVEDPSELLNAADADLYRFKASEPRPEDIPATGAEE